VELLGESESIELAYCTTLKLANLAIGLFVRIGNSKTAESQTNTSRTYIIALVAALFGFTGIASAAAGIAKFLFSCSWLFALCCLPPGWRGEEVLSANEIWNTDPRVCPSHGSMTYASRHFAAASKTFRQYSV